jgi:hypothetical protein
MTTKPLAALVFCVACFDGPVDQSAACAQYVRCIRAVDAANSQTTDLDRYDEGGACWGGEKIGELCTTSCGRALDRMRQREPALPAECAP